MKYKKEHLEGLLKLIDEITNNPGNEWFLEEIHQSTSSKLNREVSNINVNLSEIKRTRYYMKNIDKTFYVEAFKFYKNINDNKAKRALITDYKEMGIAFSDKNYLEYARRMCMQLERCIDMTIVKLNAWEVIQTDKRYSNVITLKENNNIYDFKKKFFNIENESIIPIKEISNIDFKTRALFYMVYYNVDYDKIWWSFDNIYFLRNMASHATATNKDIKKFEAIFKNIEFNIGFYYKTFCLIVDKCKFYL